MNSIVALLKRTIDIHQTKNIKFLTSLIGSFFLVLHVLACAFIRIGHWDDCHDPVIGESPYCARGWANTEREVLVA